MIHTQFAERIRCQDANRNDFVRHMERTPFDVSCDRATLRSVTAELQDAILSVRDRATYWLCKQHESRKGGVEHVIANHALHIVTAAVLVIAIEVGLIETAIRGILMALTIMGGQNVPEKESMELLAATVHSAFKTIELPVNAVLNLINPEKSSHRQLSVAVRRNCTLPVLQYIEQPNQKSGVAGFLARAFESRVSNIPEWVRNR
ncbi:MAG: hypothetical protein S4CHLAM102_05790 [Chlamydiia bacterium]|nr:hypothetical protein [Chlamydiia bacterium]